MSTGIKLAVFSALCLIWSSTWVMIKVGLSGAPPLTAAGLRFIIASLIIIAIVIKARVKIPRSREFIVLTLFLGIFQMAAPYALVYWAEQYISSGLTAILFTTMPLMVALLARIFLGDALTARKVGGILIGIAGVYVIFSGAIGLAGPRNLWGISAALAAAFLASVSSIVVKRFSQGYHPFASVCLTMGYAALIVGSLALIAERDLPIHWNVKTVTSILYLAVFGSVVGFSLFFWVIKHMDVTVLSYQTFIIPILATLLGWIFLGEKVTFQVAIGGGLILLGIVLAVFPHSTGKRMLGA